MSMLDYIFILCQFEMVFWKIKLGEPKKSLIEKGLFVSRLIFNTHNLSSSQ